MVSLAGQFNQFQLQLVQYVLPIILVLGTLGNLLNIMVFCRRTLRTNVCSWYFICLSVTHLLQLNILCMTQIISVSTDYNLASESIVFCKIRQYAFDLIMILSRHFLCLIAIDRWMVTSSSVWLRQLSSPRIARWVIVISIIFWMVFGIHSAIGITIASNLCIAPISVTYQVFYSMYSIVASVLPIILMIVFSLLAVKNVRVLRFRRVQPKPVMKSLPSQKPTLASESVGTSSGQNQRNSHLIRLSIIQVIIYLLLNSVWAISPLYAFITTMRMNQTSEERLWTAFLIGFGFNLIFTYTALTLPIYTLASRRFRRQLILMVKDCWNGIHRRFIG